MSPVDYNIDVIDSDYLTKTYSIGIMKSHFSDSRFNIYVKPMYDMFEKEKYRKLVF